MKGKLILRAFFARSPDVSTVLFRYYLLGSDTAALSWLLARLCHTFLVLQHLNIMEADISEPTNHCQTEFDHFYTAVLWLLDKL